MSTHFIFAAAIGVALDFVFGDPVRMPHIVRLIGYLCVVLEKRLVALLGRNVFSGLILWLILVGGFGLAYHNIARFLEDLNPWARVLFDALIIFQSIAFKDLVKHIRAVKTALHANLETARDRVAMIVGRDTNQMDESDICRAAIESGSENLNDAVIAPLFWLVALGPIGALVFRISNTLDAIIGHRTERCEKFGKISARIDDVMNFIPARLCSLLILLPKEFRNWRKLKPDAQKHPSLNAGWPEAAMAKRLGVVIGGRMYEKGKLVQTAEMNEGARQPTPKDIERCIQQMRETYLIALGLSIITLTTLSAFA